MARPRLSDTAIRRPACLSSSVGSRIEMCQCAGLMHPTAGKGKVFDEESPEENPKRFEYYHKYLEWETMSKHEVFMTFLVIIQVSYRFP